MRFRGGMMVRPSSAISMGNDDSMLVVVYVALLMIFAPMIQGGNSPIPMLILELGSLVLLGRVVMRPAFHQHLSGALQWTLLLLFCIPLIYLIPLPQGLWGALPGRGWYHEIIDFVGADPSSLRQISIVPFQTEIGWYILFYPLGIFLVAIGMTRRRLLFLTKVIVAVAVFQAILGLIQFGQGPESSLRFGNPFYIFSAVGTYVNRNHLASLLYMAIPLAIVLIGASLDRTGVGRGRAKSGGPHDKLPPRQGSSQLPQVIVLMVAITAIMVGLVFTRSRAGIGFGMLGLFLAAGLFVPRFGSKGFTRVVSIVTVISIFLVLGIGLGPVLFRFVSADTIDNLRWEIFSATLDGIRAFNPLGAGPSSFQAVFPYFQPLDLLGFVNRAHNDYLELVFDGGVLLLVPSLVLLVIYVIRCLELLRQPGRGDFKMLQLAAGLSMFLVLLHGTIDFNFHIPANIGYFAFLAAILFHRESVPGDKGGHQREQHEKRGSENRRLHEIPKENLINPFTD